MDKIYTGYIPVVGFQGNVAAYHKYILYQNATQNLYIRGGPESREEHVGVSRSFWGNIVTESGPYVEGTVDFNDEGNHYRELIATGNDLSAQYEIMQSTAGQINSYNIQYHSVFRNSNSVVDTVLNAAGLPLPQNDGVGAHFAPGSDILLTPNMNFPPLEGQIEQGVWAALKAANPGLNINLLTECFPADTSIQLASGEFTPIASIRTGDNIAAFNGKNFRGRGGLDSKSVVRLFENITDTWIKLSWEGLGGKELSSLTTGATAPSANNLAASAEGPALAGSRERIKTLTVTPGHHFLDCNGGFRAIADILADDSQIVLADGTLAAVSGEYIHYSAETADMFEQAEGYQPAHANQNISPPQSLYAI